MTSKTLKDFEIKEVYGNNGEESKINKDTLKGTPPEVST